ncbi:hypothetical protein C8J57DRAFT_1733997 [Mycena rebaudengoi]|nr:hypothetical protein C8J57DRAFT_1733997 [Mycena rebaudengoi]
MRSIHRRWAFWAGRLRLYMIRWGEETAGGALLRSFDRHDASSLFVFVPFLFVVVVSGWCSFAFSCLLWIISPFLYGVVIIGLTKDAVIESLSKQRHTTLDRVLPDSDLPLGRTSNNILSWLDRLQMSVPTCAVDAEGTVFKQDSNTTGSCSALPGATGPLGMIADLSLRNGKGGKGVLGELGEELNDDNVGVANAAYFMPGPAADLGMRAQLIEQHSPPDILIPGLVVAEKLFEILHFKYLSGVGLYNFHSHLSDCLAQCCTHRNPRSFCAVSSRYYPEKAEIYPLARHLP